MMNEFFKFKTLKSKIILIITLAAIAWCTSITTEFVGYDDIKLIIRNDKIQESILYAMKFYFNIVSDSHNVAWTNYPTVIFRPLEWVGSSIGYHIWGPRSWAYHLFVNYSFHILCSLIFFFILSKIFFTPLFGNKNLSIEDEYNNNLPEKTSNLKQKQKAKFAKQTKVSIDTKSVTWWLPLIIIAFWAVHPLHNEAINMLTSGVGYLFATLLCITAFVINLYVKDLKSPSSILLIVFAWICAFVGYHGSEMTVIAPFMLLLVFARSLLSLDFKKYYYEFLKLVFSFSTLVVYLGHRSEIVSEKKEWLANGVAEFFERLFVLAPQIYMHYIKLFFYPANLSADEHHNVVLENAFTPYHLICLLVALAFVFGIFYFAYLKEEKYKSHNILISGSLFFTGFSIAISLNIIPLYVLARDRYTYFFVLGLLCSIFLILDKYIFTRITEQQNFNRKLITVCSVLIFALGVRSAFKSLDWRNGEAFWTQTINSIDDIGAQQNWRYRLMQYYKDPGTTTFKADEDYKAKILKDFENFPSDNNLFDINVIKKYQASAKDPKKHIKNKYGYVDNKTIASGLFFNATEVFQTCASVPKDNVVECRNKAINIYRLAHLYYPEHYQTNLQLLILTYGMNQQVTQSLLQMLFVEAKRNSFLAKGLMDSLFFIKYPDIYRYASQIRDLFPKTQVFSVYAFHSAVNEKKYSIAYDLAKSIIKKYHEQDIFEKYIKMYEAGKFQQG